MKDNFPAILWMIVILAASFTGMIMAISLIPTGVYILIIAGCYGAVFGCSVYAIYRLAKGQDL